MPKLNIEEPRQCPFSKNTQTKYDLVGPDYTPVPAITTETFNICIGEDCMLYHYDPKFNIEVCMLGGNPYK